MGSKSPMIYDACLCACRKERDACYPMARLGIYPLETTMMTYRHAKVGQVQGGSLL